MGLDIEPGRLAAVEATVNGALTVGDGLNIKLNTTELDLEIKLDETMGIGTSEFAITGGGALFQLGPQVTSNQQVNIGIQSMAASKLGTNAVGFLSDIVQRIGIPALEAELHGSIEAELLAIVPALQEGIVQ